MKTVDFTEKLKDFNNFTDLLMILVIVTVKGCRQVPDENKFLDFEKMVHFK